MQRKKSDFFGLFDCQSPLIWWDTTAFEMTWVPSLRTWFSCAHMHKWYTKMYTWIKYVERIYENETNIRIYISTNIRIFRGYIQIWSAKMNAHENVVCLYLLILFAAFLLSVLSPGVLQSQTYKAGVPQGAQADLHHALFLSNAIFLIIIFFYSVVTSVFSGMIPPDGQLHNVFAPHHLFYPLQKAPSKAVICTWLSPFTKTVLARAIPQQPAPAASCDGRGAPHPAPLFRPKA